MICLVTDRHGLPQADQIGRLVELVEGAAQAGVDLVHVRERDLSTIELTRLVGRCVAAARGTATKIVVNDRADVAFAAGAHGVHLRADSIPAPAARRVLGAEATIGRSIHGVDEAAAAVSDGGIDYLVFGTLFHTPSKERVARYATLDDLAAVCRSVPVPVLAIGGMSVGRAAEVARAGAAGIAAIRLFVPPPGVRVDTHLREVVSALRRVFDSRQAVS